MARIWGSGITMITLQRWGGWSLSQCISMYSNPGVIPVKYTYINIHMGVFINGVTQNVWFIMEDPIEMDELGVPPLQETAIYIYIYLYVHNTGRGQNLWKLPYDWGSFPLLTGPPSYWQLSRLWLLDKSSVSRTSGWNMWAPKKWSLFCSYFYSTWYGVYTCCITTVLLYNVNIYIYILYTPYPDNYI